MSSSSSYSSELTSSSSLASEADDAEPCFNGASVTAASSPKGDTTSGSFILSDSNDKSQSQRSATAFSPAPGSRVDGLLPKERIHRYIDQCVAPALMQHQRATDGYVLVQLCKEILQLGGPEEWAGRLPSCIFTGSVQSQHFAEGDTDTTASTPPACTSNGVLYGSEEVPATWEEDMRERGSGAQLPAHTVPWDSLTRHLHQLVTRLNQLITRDGGQCPCYTLPFRLQARVTPVLYAWATHWPLVGANVRCWNGVVKAFHAACGAHQQARNDRLSSCYTASPLSSSVSPLMTGFSTTEGDATAEKVDTPVRYTFTLPWKPLAALFLATLEPSNVRLASWNAVVSAVRRELPALCRRASRFFTPDAVDGLWGLICSDVQRAPSGVAALSLFVQLVPYHHLCEVPAAPSQRSHSCGDDDGGGTKEAAVVVVTADASGTEATRLTPRAQQILRFLLVETAAWSPPMPPVPPSVTQLKMPERRGGARRLLMPWRTAVMFFVSSLARAHPAVAGLDDYAEPLFTAWLAHLYLPISSSAGLTGAASATAVSRVVRTTVAGSAAAGVGNCSSGCGVLPSQRDAAEVKSSRLKWTAVPYVRLINAFPDNTDSSLWRQLERWIHATKVLVRPGLPCSPGSAAERVCKCYCQLAREALRRVPKGRMPSERALDRRQDTTCSDVSAATSGKAEEAARASPCTLPARYWSQPTIDKFVQLFLPLAVSAFLTRAKMAADFLTCLLYMSPTIALPALLKCVDAGLNSPTEVAAQRRVSALLLMHTIATLFTDDARFATEAARAARGTVAEYFQNCALQLLSLVSPSTPEVALSVLTLFGVAVSYIPTSMIMQSSYEAEVLGTEYASRVIPLFTERGTERGRANTTRQEHVEVFIAALPPSALAMVARSVLQESQNRDHGNGMCELVRMIAVAAPTEAWRCAEQTWLPVLTDPLAGDAEVEWAGALLAACVSELGDRQLARCHATDIAAAVHAQLRFLTSKQRRTVAVQLTNALVASLMRPRWTSASSFCVPKLQRRAENIDAAGRATGGTPLSLPSARAESGEAATTVVGATRTGTATAARVRVELPEAEADVRAAASFFNDALRDVMQIVTHAKRIRVCSPATAAATDVTAAPPGSFPLAFRFLGEPAEPGCEAATAVAGVEAPCVSESASTVNPHNVLEGALEWLLRLLEIFEWMYVEPSPSIVTKTATAAATASRGVHWRDINPRTAWRPFRLPVDCLPAFSRAELFDVAYTHLCIPLLEHHVFTPLQKAGVELRPYIQPLLPGLKSSAPATVAAAADTSSADTLTEDGVVEWNCVCGLLRWLVLSGVDCPQHFWLPRETLFFFWSRVLSRNPSCRSRKRIPLSGWASRALQLHVEALVAGYLPVSPETLSRTITVLQCLTFSPHEAVRSSSLHLLINDKLVSSLNAASLILFMQRQYALAAQVLARARTLRGTLETVLLEANEIAMPPSKRGDTSSPSPPVLSEGSRASAEGGAGSAGSTTVSPSTTSNPQTVLHFLQESSNGTLSLCGVMIIKNLFTKAPWYGLHALRWLMTFPEELRTLSTARVLPLIQKTFDTVPPADTTTSRAPQYVEALVQLASNLVSAHPARAVLLLTLVKHLYWPSSQRLLSLHAVRLLARLSLSVHVEVRSRATELLSAVAVHVSVREPLVWVNLLGDTQDTAAAAAGVPSSFLLSAEGIAKLAEDDRRTHDASVRMLQASLQRLRGALPTLPQHLSDRGQVFLPCAVAVPKSVALSTGLPLLSRNVLTSSRNSFTETPTFLAALAEALPLNMPSFRTRWAELLMRANSHTAASFLDTSAFLSPPPPPLSSTCSPVSTTPTAVENAGCVSWVLQLLTLPIERPLAGMAQEASPMSLVNLLASLHDGTAASAQRITQLLAWAEDNLQRWEATQGLHGHTQRSSGDSTKAEKGLSVMDAGSNADRAAGPHSVSEDDMYRLFLSVLTVATAVVRLSAPASAAVNAVKAPDSAAAVTTDLRDRALLLLELAITCVCGYAVVPHAVMRSMMLLGIAAARNFLSMEETWRIFSGVSEKLRSSPAESTPAAVEPAAEAATSAKSAEDDVGDLWSQRQLRFITVILMLEQEMPLSMTATLLPRLVEQISKHWRVYFMAPADQVRQCASRLIARFIAMGRLRGGVLTIYHECYPAARRLLCTLLDSVNAQVFQGRLTFAFAKADGDGVEGQRDAREAAERPFTPAAVANAPAPSLFAAPSADDVSLLTTAALTMQAIPIDVFLDFTDDLLMLLCYILDFSFTKVQHLHEAADTALQALTMSWMPKAYAHRLLGHLCAICTGAVGYGVSRRAKAACTRVLRFVVFRNLHRIGKYSMMLQVGDAALASLAHRDMAVRSEGSQLFAILTKVASESQTRVMVQAICSECRQLSKKSAALTPLLPAPPPHVQLAPTLLSDATNTPSSAADTELTETATPVKSEQDSNRRMAVVQALGAVVLADPGVPSPYVPKVMEVLASCAREGNTECGRFAKRVFEQWWHAHREGWEQEYKKYFTPEQVNEMTDLLFAPRYYA
jgi:hypothetical protein